MTAGTGENAAVAVRRGVASLLVVAGLAACVLSVLGTSGGVVGDARFAVTTTFLVLGPGWAAAGFLRRAPAAHVWLLAIGVGVAATLLVGQLMVSTALWHPAIALYGLTVLSVPFLLRHALAGR